jgi:hypothetical protein
MLLERDQDLQPEINNMNLFPGTGLQPTLSRAVMASIFFRSYKADRD